MKPSILHYILLHVGIVADAYIDHTWIKKSKDPHTFWQFFWRAFGFLGLSAGFAYWYDNTYAWMSLICSVFVYWWTFDTLLNIIRFRSFKFKDLIYLSDKGIDYYQRPLELWFFFKLVFAVIASCYFFDKSLFEL